MAQVKPVPEGFNTLSAHLTIKGATAAIDFYRKAFGAEVIERIDGPGGHGVMYASLKIGNSAVMLNDEFPDWGVLSPSSIGGTSVTIHLYVDDVDTAFQRAVAAGATETMPVSDAFWGDRYGKLTDPFGHQWSIATHKQDLTTEQIQQAAAAAFG